MHARRSPIEALPPNFIPACVIFLGCILAACGALPQGDLPTSAPIAIVTTALPLEHTATPTAVTATPAPPTALPPTATPLAPTPTASPPPLPSATPLPTPCAEDGRVESAQFSSAVSGGDQRYAVYLPPCYAAVGAAYPVLYLLAGNIHDEHAWDRLGIDEVANTAIRQGHAPPLIVVMPDGGWLADNTSGGPGSYETVILDELIPHVESNYCAWSDAAGRAIGGLSRGGYWALEIAFRFPHLFTSVGGHSAALLDTFAGPAVNPQYTALSNDLGDLRIYLDIGAEDFVRANTIRLHDDMQAAAVPHEWHLNEGQHVDAYWAAHAADYLAWYVAPWPLDRRAYPPCTGPS